LERWIALSEYGQEADKKVLHLQDEAIETNPEMKHSAHIILAEVSTAYKKIRTRPDD
jgi:hypothetical protein